MESNEPLPAASHRVLGKTEQPGVHLPKPMQGSVPTYASSFGKVGQAAGHSAKANKQILHVILGACIVAILFVYYLTGNSSQTLVWILFFPVKICYLIFFSLLRLPVDQSILISLFIGAPLNAGLWIFAFGTYKSER